uniref:Uncharacterized protein n=1 Tax=viral metagenome TaxID=1070528 RepID=A0A6C0DAV6_9ZZZZ
MKTIDYTMKNLNVETLQNPGLYKTIYANELTINDIGKKVYLIHRYGISCRKITKVSDRHFIHSALDNSNKAESLISYFVFPMYMNTSRDKLFDTSIRIILDNAAGNNKLDSVMEFFNNRYLVSYTSSFLE